MCVVSMVGDFYQDKWKQIPQQFEFYPIHPVTSTNITLNSPFAPQEQFESLRKEVLEMKELLKRAKIYDEANGEKDCEMANKIALLRKVADLVGVDLNDVFQSQVRT